MSDPDADEVRAQNVRIGEALMKLAANSVLALFVPGDDGHPFCIGSCVLARLLGEPFIVTAGHVVKHIKHPTIHFAAQGRNLKTLTNCRGFWFETEDGGLDMGLIPLSGQPVSLFDELVFLPSAHVDIETEKHPLSTNDWYVVFGWPRSNSRLRIDKPERHIKHGAFIFNTGIATTPLVRSALLSPESHLIFDFNREQVTLDGATRYNPPDPDGISGGAAFRVADGKLRLAGIMTEHRRDSRMMVATRMTEFIPRAQEIIDDERKRAG